MVQTRSPKCDFATSARIRFRSTPSDFMVKTKVFQNKIPGIVFAPPAGVAARARALALIRERASDGCAMDHVWKFGNLKNIIF